MYTKTVTASGHPLVSETARDIMIAGGNAFDAVVAAGFVSTVVEPVLNSLGGGGLLVGRSETAGQNLFFDFFVDTPGRGAASSAERNAKDFFPISVEFPDTVQEFNIGAAAAAVPGTLKGLFHIHKKLGRMALKDVLFNAKKFASAHVISASQYQFLVLTRPILLLSDYGRLIYQPQGQFVEIGDTLQNSELATFFDLLAEEGADEFYQGEIAASIHEEMAERGGLLTKEDLATYEVIEREPMSVSYRGGEFLTAAEPSMGGPLIALQLGLQQLQSKSDGAAFGSPEMLERSYAVMKEVEELRKRGITTPEAVQRFLQNENINSEDDDSPLFSRGTTHISVADGEGNCASMTCSNGEGCGVFAPGTGVMLNNMMGEDDLHPEGFHSSPPGQRVHSMMSPSVFIKDGKGALVLGSGGSKRIRSAVSQVLSLVVDYDMPLQQAIDAPRLYLDEDLLQLEPGYGEKSVTALKALVKVNQWREKDVYFGGVHAVIPGVEGAGDARRGGSVAEGEVIS